MIDFLSELTLSDAEVEAEAEADQVKVRDEVYSLHSIGLDLQWTLSVDGSSNMRGCDAGILLESLDGERYMYSLRFSFRASNNEAKYETFIAGLEVAKEIDISNILILSDS